MASFAQPSADENLVPGWDVQANAPLGYGSVAGNSTASYGPGQVSSGVPNPPGAMNTGTENSGSYASQVLVNPGYADGTGHAQTALGTGNLPSAPAVPTSGVVAANPTNLVAQVTVTGGTLTFVKTGTAGQTYAQATQAGTADGTYTVAPGGVIGITYSVAPTWTWAV